MAVGMICVENKYDFPLKKKKKKLFTVSHKTEHPLCMLRRMALCDLNHPRFLSIVPPIPSGKHK